MNFIPIGVGCHSGYEADEYPEYFILEEKRFEILEISDRWYQAENIPGYPVSDYFEVRTQYGVYLIRHEPAGDNWYLCISDKG